MKSHSYSIQTERLLLRAPNLDDYERWRAGHLASKPQQHRFDKVPRSEDKLTEDNFLALLSYLKENSEADNSYVFYGFRQSDQQWVVTVTVFDILRLSQQTSWMGYHVFNPYWGQGYAAEAVKAVLTIAFENVCIHRVEVLTELENIASQRVAEKVGMRYEGLSQKRVLQRGEWCDVKIYAMTLEDSASIVNDG